MSRQDERKQDAHLTFHYDQKGGQTGGLR
ncbi:hypothetical protein CO2235_U770189 [Cupriavidus oxalaticus]|uniref:Uncharacterized protein n=1 Tax=Cupriavidus oxalaticus TaxID=96344 RepID=A0A375FRQ4_9BURK|nr:hypothetical protein CO2235_U770189 [Cupriavidus oxalaticus]